MTADKHVSLELYAQDWLEDPSRRARMAIPDVEQDGTYPRLWQALIWGLLLVAPIWLVILALVWLTTELVGLRGGL